ncbi:hypothetical protein D3C72_1888040 [compost metagenome]
MSNKNTLDGMCPGAAAAALGTRVDALITLTNELRDKWSGDYTPDPAALTWAGDVKALANELKTFAGAVKDLANDIKAEFNKLQVDVAALRTAYEAHRADTDAHAAADTTNTAPSMTASAVAESDLTAISSGDVGDLASQSIDLPAIDAPAVAPLDQ